MAAKVTLIILVILLALVIILPFILNLVGFNILQFGSVGGGARAGEPVLLRSLNGGVDWEDVSNSGNERIQFPSRVTHFALHPTNPEQFFFGTQGAGLWRSDNGGAQWKQVSDKSGVLKSSGDVHKIAISKSQPNVIYLAVFQDKKGRVLRSEDGGDSFHEIYFVTAERSAVFEVYVSNSDANRVIIGTEQGGVLESRNGGKTWRVLHWFTGKVTEILVNPLNPFELFAVINGRSLFKSVDGGENWADLNNGLHQLEFTDTVQISQPDLTFDFFGAGGYSIQTIIFDPRSPAILYLGSSDGLLRSLDGGFSWKRLSVLIPPEALPVNAVAVHPQSSQTIFASAATQLHRSDDGGINWSVKTISPNTQIKSIIINPVKTERMFAVLGR